MKASAKTIFKTQNPMTLERLLGAVAVSDIDMSPVEVDMLGTYLLLHRMHK
jgi:hypothetical protein